VMWRDGQSSQITDFQIVSTAWKPVAATDFTGDGKADLLWRNETTGENHLWRGGDPAQSMVLGAVPDLNWKPIGIAGVSLAEFVQT
jgi:hypothetical protein